MGELGTTFAFILVFTLIGGFFAASETALVSLRESQVHRLAESDPRRGHRDSRATPACPARAPSDSASSHSPKPPAPRASPT